VATVSSGLIARPRLAKTLADAFDAGSVLLVAGPGYGKTMALEEALEFSGRRALWIPCGDAGHEGARLLMNVVEGLRTVVPGLADVVGDRLAAGREPVDARTASAALLPELERLLVEPLVIVFDDGEQLEGVEDAIALLDGLLALRAPLSVAIATRRPLPLRLAKLRAAGRLTEIGPPELSFTASECEELLGLRHGRTLSEDEVEAVLAASEGWPMGVALSGLTGASEPDLDLLPREGLFNYLAEEVLDRLDPAMRLGLVASSVPDKLTPEMTKALGLPPDFLEGVARSGLFLRTHPSGVRSYHPLFRAFLRERLRDLRTDEERSALHARAAECLTESGRTTEAIDHWFEAGMYEEALQALVVHGVQLVRTSLGTVAAWLERLPREFVERPDYQYIEGQRRWAAGRQDLAAEPFKLAVAGYAAQGEVHREWFARALLADCLLLTGAFADVAALAEGWEQVPSPVAISVAWFQVPALHSRGLTDEADQLAERLKVSHPEMAGQFSFLEALGSAQTEFSSGRPEKALDLLHAAAAQLKIHDRHGRRPYILGMVLAIMRNLGDREAALEWLDVCERDAESVGLGFAVRDFGLQRASLLAQAGELSQAEVHFGAAGKRPGTGWRAVYEASAEAQVANLRGDSATAASAAARALELGAMGPMPWRVLAATEMSQVLADAGAADAARYAIDIAWATLDQGFTGERGRFHRAWLGASRACLEYKAGEPDAARESMRACWGEAGGLTAQMLRAHWPAIRPVLWHALAEGAIAPEDALAALQDAFPGGDALVAMIEHPDRAVRRAALLAALSSTHPAVLARLADLEADSDEQVAAAAAATSERLRAQPPPLRFELLGGFRVRRAGWELDEAAWQRPMAARVVRFLLIQDSGVVPEDVLFEAFWPDRDTDSARQHLAQAISRARKVLDLPGQEQSVIEAKERTFRLRLRERDSVDAHQFEAAATAALKQRGPERRTALEGAAALWSGEPLPEDRYSPWTFAWRERLTQSYSQVLGALVDTHESAGDDHNTIRAATRLLELDPLNERAHQQLMAAYARTGQKSQALRQFLECRRALVSDLGVEPSAETAELQARILAGDPV
jgi:ATP/maltotriose-dependent transcriptional regulator MalT/DNA-binding SARP family transcriptional activator